MNSKRNRIINILKISIIIGFPIILQSFANHRNNIRKIQKVDITRLGSPKNIQYITNDAIENLLFSIKNPEEYLTKEININLLEKRLDANPMVENADIYLTIDGIVKVIVKQREPIARIVNNDQFYYMDMQGKQMPLSNAYSARVPIVRGITETVWEDTHLILSYIYKDNFLKENIVEVIADKGVFYAKLRGADFLVCLGNAQDISLKFNNLKAFYRKASKDHFLDRYTMINLQYNNQVVCTKPSSAEEDN
ncbi:hypothetical protein HMPREF9071_1466 [Capnocytophaga sp. oral taxon 338 str. F0234]|jgi:hypothetical protein|nr:hypothetical protein HMPREF9071_1466 [Capnocytophaga sp. oral taxon 338 str. F0234]